MLLTFAYVAIASAGANVPYDGGSSGAYLTGESAVEPAHDQDDAPSPLAPTDVDDDDDDEREVFTQPSHVVPWVGRTTRRTESTGETIQSSLGHQRGIDDPPRY